MRTGKCKERSRFKVLLNVSLNLGSALTLALSPRRGNKRILAPFSLGRRAGDEGQPFESIESVRRSLQHLPPESISDDEQSIRKFRALKESSIAAQSTFENLRQVLQDFEQDQVGAIAFSPLSQVFWQCLVYPLALVEGDQAPIHPLVLESGKPITPQIDLCNAKGSYDHHLSAFQMKRYPLMYSLSVVSLRNNARPPVGRKFSAILRTIEGQKLLNKTGLVLLQPLSTTRQ